MTAVCLMMRTTSEKTVEDNRWKMLFSKIIVNQQNVLPNQGSVQPDMPQTRV